MEKSRVNKNYKTIKLFEAFAGIGSQYKALKNISEKKNWNIQSVGTIEWFISAIIGYQAIHYPPKKVGIASFNNEVSLSYDSKTPVSAFWMSKNLTLSEYGFWLTQSIKNSNNLFDIRKVKAKDLPKDIDIFTYSFPCQDISHQGLQKGFKKSSNTRSGLLWEIDRILTEIMKMKDDHCLPKYLLLENVKAMTNKKNAQAYNNWLRRLDTLGYVSKQYILNSINFGNPQNRERVFVLSVLKTHKKTVSFEFKDLEEIKLDNKLKLKTILDMQQLTFAEKYNKYKLVAKHLNSKSNVKKYTLSNYTSFASENSVFDINYSGTTLTASGAMSRIKLYFGHDKIRDMLPLECFQYMGFTKKDYENIKKFAHLSDSKLIYLCGNAIVVSVLEAIFETLEF